MSGQSAHPLVSVVVIFLDEAKYLTEAVESVLAQSYTNWELLLVDDGSTDRSTAIARDYAARYAGKVQYLEHEGHRNRGMSATRNLGLRHSRGKYVAFLDGDDVWLPEKLARQVPILESQPETGMLYAPTTYWRSWRGPPEDREHDNVPDLGVPLDTLFEPPYLLTHLHPLGQETAPCMCSLLVRKEVFAKIGGFEESFHGYYEDQAFLSKVYLSEKVFVSAGCWDRYRIHPESCCATVERSGQRDSIRKSFLEWFKRYLQVRGVTNSAIWNALEDALQTFEQPQKKRDTKWLLRLAEGNVARLVRRPENPDLLRVEISRTKSDKTYDTQLNLPGLKLHANREYTLKFVARADAPREVSFGCAQAHSPWLTLGLYEQIQLTTQWLPVERAFVVPQDDADGRILFDVGVGEPSVELSSVTLLDHSTGLPVEQEGVAEIVTSSGTRAEPTVPVNEVDFGSFRRLSPISRDFGCDRGRPVDRYYIENFLERNANDVRGRVLEVGENTYTRRYGGERVTMSDILHVVEGEPHATIIADLASADHIPSNTFDCIILTQTLQLIYDVPAAVRTLRRILKPSGVLLATFPGISQSYDHEWASTWYWNFTAVAARRLFAEGFSAANVKVETFGNVLAAMSFLHGLAVEELTPEELDHREPGYDVSITVRAVKPAGDGDEPAAPVPVRGPQSAPRPQPRPSDPRAIILMYHRVATGSTDPFSLAVTPQNFAEQLDVLRKFTTPMRLRDFVKSIDNGSVPRKAAIVTFDDGYADNLINAKPLLESRDIPATVYLTTGYIGGRREFWWDELDRLLLQPGVLPQTLRLTINGITHEWNLCDDANYSAERWRRYRAWESSQLPPTSRHAVFFAVWRLLQLLPEAQRLRTLEELQSWANVPGEARPTHQQLTEKEVNELVRGDLIEAGAHTVTHPVLASLPPELQREEIQQSKARAEEILERPVVSFAYPFGSRPDFTKETETIVGEAGFTSACSTQPGLVGRNPRPFEFPRFQVNDWNGDEFAKRLTGWLSG